MTATAAKVHHHLTRAIAALLTGKNQTVKTEISAALDLLNQSDQPPC